ncbi:MAG: dihydrolipoyl dehydrogenase [Actinobacteria bacterium]|nr:dihydrolipoyl dehydrogenase [Actinomycetota bacterium]
MEAKNTDVAILGAGPGGYVAAIRAKKLGLNVIAIEKENLGGVCLNWGCIPTKTLAHTAEVIESVKKSGEIGINFAGMDIDFKNVMARKDKVVSIQRGGLEYNFKKNEIEIVRGAGKLVSQNKINVKSNDGKDIEINAKNIILATGSHASDVPPFITDNEGILDNIGILSLKELPKSMLVVGGGVIGCEFSSIFSTLGTKVTIVEIMPRILLSEDEEVGELIKKVFAKKGINIYTGVTVKEVKKVGSQYTCILSNGESVTVDKILISVGRKPNTDSIGLKEAGVELDSKGFIRVDKYLRTNIKNIYAIGDVIGGYQLAHVASAEGLAAIDNISGKNKEMKYNVVPLAIFTLPEIGTVGLGKKQAEEKGYKVCMGMFPFKNSGKAFVVQETEGFIKIFTDSATGEILGSTMIGPRASDLIHEVAVAMNGELPVDYIADTIHAHPTLSEAVMETAEDCFGLSTHKV